MAWVTGGGNEQQRTAGRGCGGSAREGVWRERAATCNKRRIGARSPLAVARWSWNVSFMRRAYSFGCPSTHISRSTTCNVHVAQHVTGSM